MLSLLLALPLVALPQEHAALHPADADLYLEVPDVAGLLAAYDAAPAAGFLREEAMVEALAGAGIALDPERTVGEWLTGALPDLAALFRGGRLSLSLGRPPEAGFPGLLAIADLAGSEDAETLRALLVAQAASTVPLEGALEGAVALQGVPAISIPLWVAHRDTRVLLGGGDVSPDDAATLLAGEAPGFDGNADVASARAHFEEPAGTTLLWLAQRSSALDTLTEADRRIHLLGGRLAAFPFRPPPGFDPFAGRRVQRVRLQEGAFRTETFVPGAHGELATPDLARLAEVPGDTMLVLTSSFDGARAAASVRELVGDLVALPDAEETLWTPLREQLSALGPDLLLYAHPLQGLAPPKTYLWVDAPGGPELQTELAAHIDRLGAHVPGLATKTREYHLTRDGEEETIAFPVTTITLPTELLELGPVLSTVSPAFAWYEGRLLLGLRTTDVKREVKRLHRGDEEGEDPFARSGVTIAEGTTSALYLDWAYQASTLLQLLQTLGPLLGELPFDPSALPPARLLREHFPPSVRVARAVEGGTVELSTAATGPEVGVALVLGALELETLLGLVDRRGAVEEASTDTGGDDR